MLQQTGVAVAPFDPTTEGWKIMKSPGGFSALVGPIWARKRDGTWEYGFIAEDKHENRQGAIHGGMLMTFADHAIGMAAWEGGGRRKCVTMQLETQFLAPVVNGDFVECRAEIVRAARTVVFMRGFLLVRERPVLAATGIWKIVE
jgi:uncharacterized protein (TIGR00369 family)